MGKYVLKRKVEKQILTIISACEQLGALVPTFCLDELNCSGENALFHDIILTMSTTKYERFNIKIPT